MGRSCPSNNSNSSSSEDERNIFDLPLTWQDVPDGIPTHCCCGEAAVIKTHTLGAHIGRRYYSCASPMDDGDCHIWKLWDDAIMEEILQLKNRARGVEDRLLEWIGSPDHMSPTTMWDLFHSCEEEKEKLKELVTKLERSDKETNDLKEMVKELQTKVFVEKKMQLTSGVVVCAVMVIVILVLFKY